MAIMQINCIFIQSFQLTTANQQSTANENIKTVSVKNETSTFVKQTKLAATSIFVLMHDYHLLWMATKHSDQIDDAWTKTQTDFQLHNYTSPVDLFYHLKKRHSQFIQARVMVCCVYACFCCLMLNNTHHPPQPFYGPFSGTIWLSRCQKRTSGLYGARGD